MEQPENDVGSNHRATRRPRYAATLALIAGVSIAPLMAVFACSGNGDSNTFTSSSTGAGAAGGSGSTGTGGTGGDDIFKDSGPPASAIAISPINPILKVTLPLSGQTVQFNCTDVNTNQPAAGATWSMDTLSIGSISATGVFTPNGLRAGQVNVTCTAGGHTATTKLTVLIHAVDNMGGLTQQQQDTLRGPPGLSDSSWQILYPYDKTVFPRGILAPEVHLTQGQSPGNAYYMHIISNSYEYEGFFNVSATSTQLQMSQAAWDALTFSAGGTKVDVQISKIYNGQKYGPIYRQWVLAAGTLHGTIYYNTYDSPLAGNGAMLRIKGNSPTPEVLLGNCTVCHSIGSDGSTAAAANHSGQGGVFDLTGGMLNPPTVWNTAEEAAFAAIFPKLGKFIVTNGAPGFSYPPNTPGTNGNWTSTLHTKTGTLIPNSGIEMFYAMSPVFSHDGTKLSFNDRSSQQVGGQWPGVLSIMDFNEVAQKFTNYQVLATPPPGRQYSWPAFTPDNKFVVFQDGVGEDLATWSGNTGKIFAVNAQTKVKSYLSNLNGDGYVPQGARDENKNYEPTIAPIASGGYFWVMFTSRRTYGNKLGANGEGPESTKRLWVSAIDIDMQDGLDGSHPAFYISGQELTSGNSRGFWALDPCKSDGQGCQSGDECCNGFCNPTNDPTQFVCGPPNGMCSDEFEPCVTDADCCNPQFSCIGGKCTAPTPH